MSADVEPIVIAEIVNKHGDPEAFAERELVVMANIQSLPIGTTLHARYPLKPGTDEAWAGIRETLQALALHGDQAELDEHDAQLLLGVLDNPAMDAQGREALFKSVAVFEQGMQALTRMSNGFLQHALEIILRIATREATPAHLEVFPDMHLRTLRHIAEVARAAIGEGSPTDPTTMSATAEATGVLADWIRSRLDPTTREHQDRSDMKEPPQ